MNDYRKKTLNELAFIIKDAGEALKCAEQNGDPVACSKYADQVNDACTERYRRDHPNHRTRAPRHLAPRS